MFLLKIGMALLAGVVGAATSAGLFALLIKLGVVPRFLTKFHLGERAMVCENAIVLGSLFGCVFSIWNSSGQMATFFLMFQELFLAYPPLANALRGSRILLLVIWGLCAGIFVGAQSIALAEILDMFPTLFRRLKLQMGLSFMVIALALGKVTGSLFYFIFGYHF